MKVRSLTAMIVCLAFLGASASPVLAQVPEGKWLGNSGQYEPSTSYDTKDYMFQGPNQAPVDKVYFNGFVIHDRFPSTNPEIAGGSIIVGDAINFAAMLGFWRDCNKDGYIGDKNVPTSYGNSNSGAYFADASADSPVDTGICPAGSPYNSGLVVDEFRWIGPGANTQNAAVCDPARYVIAGCATGAIQKDANDVSDEGANVWADFGVPDGQGGSGNPIVPRGTFDDSHSTLERIDNLPLVFVPDEAFLVPNVGECGEEREFLGGPEGQCGLYPLYQVKRLVNDSEGREERAEPIVAVYDNENDGDGSGSACDDTTLPGGLKTSDVQPGVHENPLMEGSLGGTVQNIVRGTNQGKFKPDGDGQCNGPSFPSLESDGAERVGKVHINAELTFHADKRLTTLSVVGIDSVPMDTFGLTGGPSSSWDSPYAGLSGGAKWLAGVTYVAGVTSGITGPFFTTHFADVTPEAFANSGASPTTGLPAGAQDAHEYGHLQCGGNYDDTEANRVANEYGWICSLQAWKDAEQEDASENTDILIGHKFDLRDVDCYDQTPTTGLEWRDIRVTAPTGDEVSRASCAGGSYL